MNFKNNKIYNRATFLNPKNPQYIHDLECFLGGAFISDTINGDLTTESLPNKNDFFSCQIQAKEKGIFCGGPPIKWFLHKYCPDLKLSIFFKEGNSFQKGNTLLSLKGKAKTILKIERTLLNLLQRLCGIATLTHTYQQAAFPMPIAATRKTLYGLLDKYAVTIGGGLTHRLNLGDAPLFKDNHLKISHNSWAVIANAIYKMPHSIPFATIEISPKHNPIVLLSQFRKPLPFPIIILFDNFTPLQLKKTIQNIPKPAHIHFEASGGITLTNIKKYCISPLDILSIGALTHSANSLDLSLNLTTP
ncbi:TPA: nicotinate-nucleotide diphosphorylase (carboxylating) [Candidatus Peregrinibacteria bacterium]|nr:nicotinate-nucleotide diphosphorylase (carboxylating) [Candidatus Peregrinibacteria bacterium]